MPRRLTFGASKLVREEHLRALGEAWKQRRLVLFLGAGVSTSYGIPNWDGLIRRLLVHKSPGFDGLWPHYQTALAMHLARSDSFDFSPLSLASVVKYKISHGKRDIVPTERIEEATQRQFGKITKQFLYRSYNENPQGATALATVVELINRSEKQRGGRRIPAVITFNFDDLLEMKLKEANRKLALQPIYKATRLAGDVLPIIHVNGYLPKDGDVPREGIVLAEDEFHKLTYSAFDWSTAEITSYLRNYTVLFVGLSMSDPNLRRLLYATRDSHSQPTHFLLRKDHRLSAEKRGKLIEEIKETARQEGRLIGRDEKKDEYSISKAIDVMLQEAHTYDREIFRSMGVATVWYEEFDDIPLILRAIPKYAQTARA